jgi:hypothetical protein
MVERGKVLKHSRRIIQKGEGHLKYVQNSILLLLLLICFPLVAYYTCRQLKQFVSEDGLMTDFQILMTWQTNQSGENDSPTANSF